MDDYKEIKSRLKPDYEITASEELRKKVRYALNAKGYPNKRARRFSWLISGIGISTVAVCLLVILWPSGLSANKLLTEAIDALLDVESIEMTVDVRTRPMENFQYIDVEEKFITHKIDISKLDSMVRWKIDKGERIAVGNGTDINIWVPSLDMGLHLSNGKEEKVLGYLSSLLSPRKILEKELENCVNDKGSKCKVEEIGCETILTVHSSPKGDFENPYLLNTSIPESESVRRYVIDTKTKRLKSAVVGIMVQGKEIEVLRVDSINYNPKLKDLTTLPSNIRFVDVEARPSGLSGLSAEEAAATVLSAFSDWNSEILDKAFLPDIAEKMYRKAYIGSELISIGSQFTSGMGQSVFVPYVLKHRDGSIQRHNIALQRNDSAGWIVVGGL